MKKLFPVIATRKTLLCSIVSLSVGWSTGALSQGAGGSNDAMLLLLEQNRNLQSEVQALRALVEEQGYEIRKLQRESLDRYTDTDSRLRNLEQALASGGVAGASTLSTPGSAATGVEEAQVTPLNRFPGAQPQGAAAASSTTASDTTARGSSTTPAQSTAGTIAANTRQRQDNARSALEPVVLTEQQLYQMAYDSAINSQFERAIAEFDQYLGSYPQGRFATNSHYWKGQSYLYLSRYDEAVAEYNVILQQYPADAKVPDSLYGQAIAFEGMGDVQRARQLLQQILRDYPNTGVANLADTRLRSLN